MRILFHLGAAVVFGSLYFLGKIMSEAHSESAAFLWRAPFSAPSLAKLIVYGGTIFELLAFIGAFLEIVIVMVLASGWTVDLLLGLSSAV